MKVNEYGNVALRVKKSFDLFKGGQIAGFLPDVAARLIASGKCELYVAPGEAVSNEPAAEPAVAKVAGDPVEVTFISVSGAEGEVMVPSDWSILHHAKKMSIAKKIAGTDITTAADADAAILAAINSATTE